MISRAIHVFASDFLPFPGCPRTAGSNRSMQIISGLRRAGHRVTYSMPLHNYLGKANLSRVLPSLSKEELWASEHFFEPEVVLNRVQPDIAVTCNVNTFQTPPRFANDIIQIVDLYGPLQFEGLLLDNPDYEVAMQSGALLEERCKALVQNFRSIDYVVTVSERQKYFWSAYCTLAGFSFAELNLLVCPAAFEFPSVQRNPSPQLSVVYSGGFYPWQNPNRFLEQTAAILDELNGATLHIFGGPHAGLVNEADVRKFLADLQRFRCVRYHGYRPVEEVLATLSQAWCALELMERNIERELAITGRTLEFLSTGTPVIYNNYSTLSRLIEQYSAGWTVPVDSDPPLDVIFRELDKRGRPLVEELSTNARRLAAAEFSPDKAIAPLAQLCGSMELPKRSSARSTVKAAATPPRPNHGTAAAQRTSATRVLAISPGAGSLLDARLRSPLQALHRQGLVERVTLVTTDALHHLQHDHVAYDVIVTQRMLPRTIYDVFENLSLNFLLDVDDNLLARASYRTHQPEFGIATGLRLCKAVTMPNPRLLRDLERYTGLRLAAKTFITPNGLPFTDAALDRTVQPPSQIFWIQSDTAALDASRHDVVSAVEKFSDQHDLPVLLIGKNVLRQPQFRHQISMGEMDFGALLRLLEAAPLSIGLAPLETHADRETLDFVAGKSDLKVALFAGYGHAGVYSAAPPYTDSNLQRGLTIIGNSRAEWEEALEYEFREGWKNISSIAREIRSERNIDKLARESWAPALEAARLSQPVSGAELYEAYRSIWDVRPISEHELAYLLANDDILVQCMKDENFTAWRHYTEHGRRERRHLRHGLKAQSELMAQIDREGATAILEVEKELTRLREQVRELSDSATRLTEEKDELSKEKAELSKTLAGVLDSKSWRVTAPLRNLRARH